MLVISCIKQVPDTTQVKIDPVTNTLIRDGIPFIMNPYDTHALEESLQLRDEYGVCSVALSMGPPNAEATLRKACAVGVDEAMVKEPDTICVSCPFCMTMFEDGLKDEQVQDVRVRDLTEIVAEGLR